MSFSVPVKYNLTAEKNNTLVVYNSGEELELLPSPRCISESDMILGGSLRFNQIVANGNFSKGPLTWSNIGSRPMIVKNNVLTVEINDFNTHFGIQTTINPRISANHVYAVFAEIDPSFDLPSFSLRLGSNSNLKTVALYTGRNDFSAMIKYTNPDSITNSTLSFYTSLAYLKIGTISFKNIMLMDITDMFGENLSNCIYNMEATMSGSGLNFIKTLFSGEYYEYDSGNEYQLALIKNSG